MVFTVNWAYLIVAAVANMVIGMLWYSPLLFAKPWMAAMGLRKGDIGDSGVSPMPGYIASTIFAVGQAYLIAILFNSLPLDGAAGALGIGAGLWFVTSGLANLRLKYFEDRPWSLYLIDEGNTLLVYLTMALLATIWS